MAVVVSYSPTPEGRAALDFGIKVARAREDDLKVVDGSGGRRNVTGREDQVPFTQLDEVLKSTGVRYRLQEPAPPGVSQDQAVLDAVLDPDRDIVVIGIRRRSPVGKILLGSSAQRLILDADCPVIVIKARR